MPLSAASIVGWLIPPRQPPILYRGVVIESPMWATASGARVRDMSAIRRLELPLMKVQSCKLCLFDLKTTYTQRLASVFLAAGLIKVLQIFDHSLTSLGPTLLIMRALASILPQAKSFLRRKLLRRTL